MNGANRPQETEVIARLLAAVDLALNGDWQGAHLVAQD